MAPVNGSNGIGNMFAQESRQGVEIVGDVTFREFDTVGVQVITNGRCVFVNDTAHRRYGTLSVRQHQTDLQQCDN